MPPLEERRPHRNYGHTFEGPRQVCKYCNVTLEQVANDPALPCVQPQYRPKAEEPDA